MTAVLAVNAGSSSIKVGLFDAGTHTPLARGVLEDIGTSRGYRLKDNSGRILIEQDFPPTSSGADILGALVTAIDRHLNPGVLSAVGHRVVHGGRDFSEPILIDGQVLEALRDLTPLAPLHQPRSLDPIRALQILRPDLPQVACFDTGFHHALAPPVSRYAIPRLYENAGVRKYGFHGLSYQSIAGQLAEISGELSASRTIVAHLGNGASLCAMQHGLSVDTTMGFSTLDGLMMGTRCGALDPAIAGHLHKHFGLAAEEVEDVLYRQSGLLGVSGISGDMRVLQSSKDPRAREAIDLFCFRVARETAAMTNTLAGLDSLVFTGGIGKNAPQVRADICARLGWLGVEIDPTGNERGTTDITALSSRVRVLVLATDEEGVIARQTADLSQGRFLTSKFDGSTRNPSPQQGQR